MRNMSWLLFLILGIFTVPILCDDNLDNQKIELGGRFPGHVRKNVPDRAKRNRRLNKKSKKKNNKNKKKNNKNKKKNKKNKKKNKKAPLLDLLVRYKNRDGYSIMDGDEEIEITMEDETTAVVGIRTTEKKRQVLKKDDSIEYVDFDYEVEAFGWPTRNSEDVTRSLIEDVPWGIKKVLENDFDFWKDNNPSGNIKVCVADTGYDLGHADLPKGPDVTGTDGAGEKWSEDGNGHGTHCSGTVAALGDNKGVVGVFPNNFGGKFQLVVGKALSSNGSGSVSTVMKAVANCVKQGAKVISMSLGCNGCETNSEKSYYVDLYNQGILLIAAAGNSGNSQKSYPASYREVVSVASIMENEKRSSFSQFNSQVEISGPGSDVKSTIPNNKYDVYSGTSMATPHVAAVAGLVWMYFPECKNYQIRNVLAASAKDLDSKGCDEKTGYGLVQAKKAYNLLKNGNCGGNIGTDQAVGGCGQLTNPPNNPPNNPTKQPTRQPTNKPNNEKNPTPSPTRKYTFEPTAETTFGETSQGSPGFSFDQSFGFTFDQSFGTTGNPGDFIEVVVKITTDEFPEDLFYYVVNSNNKEVMSRDYFPKKNTKYQDQKTLKGNDCYFFVLVDSHGDGVWGYNWQGNKGDVALIINGKKDPFINKYDFDYYLETEFGDC